MNAGERQAQLNIVRSQRLLIQMRPMRWLLNEYILNKVDLMLLNTVKGSLYV